MDDVTGAGLIESQVETLSFEERKNVVEERIVVRKFNPGTHFNDKEMRVE
jgi:hypothetical protein